MFVYSLRATTIKFAAVVLLCVCAIFILVVAGGTDDGAVKVGGVEINYGGMKSKEKRIAFVESFGVRVEGESEGEAFTIPENFDRVIAGYNEIQKAQGLDLSSYKGKKVTHYTYKVTNYNYDGEVYVNLCVYRNKIIALDISSESSEGFVLPLITLDPGMLKS